MGLFDYFSKKNGQNKNSEEPNLFSTSTAQDIPEEEFTEKEKTYAGTSDNVNGITMLFAFLDKNHEGKGYDDALMNPDSKHMDENIASLKNDLDRIILRVKTFYEDYIRDVDLHIDLRSRTGMVDLVDELNVKKQTAESHVKKVAEIERESKDGQGVGQGIILSYARGFRNGLAAISHHSIINKSF